MTFSSSPRFKGRIGAGIDEGGVGVTKVVTNKKCKGVCIFSNLPIMAGLCDIKGKRGICYEVVIREMKGIIAIGSSSRSTVSDTLANVAYDRDCMSSGPRLEVPKMEPSQRRISSRQFQETPQQSRLPKTRSGSDTSSLPLASFHARLPKAFSGYDAYAAIGVEGVNEFEVNSGTDVFKWKEGNDWAWRVEGHVGNFAGLSRAVVVEMNYPRLSKVYHTLGNED